MWTNRWRWLVLAWSVAACAVKVPPVAQFVDDTATDDAAQTDATPADVDAADSSDASGSADAGVDTMGGACGNCDDGNPCTDDSCGVDKQCQHKPVSVGVCSDGDPCTVEATCVDGACKVTKQKNCDDGKLCTADACVLGQGCVHTNDDGLGCSDDDPCTTNDKCLAGNCAGTPKNCGADDCNTAKCILGECKSAPKPKGLKCDDGDACTTATKCDDAGLCAGGELTDCDDGNTCTTDSCDNKIGCIFEPMTGNCSDGDACTVGDVCAGGTCQPGAGKPCDDGNGCTADGCDAVSGACTATATDAACNDGNFCTLDDVCQKGVCAPGKVVDCDDGNPCTVDSCEVGNCLHVASSAACDDGDACSVGDTCVDGKCKGGGAKLCVDKDTCTADSCNPKTGQCENTPVPGCGDVCAKVQDCPGGDVCNLPACLAGKCAFLPTTEGCDDGSACTVGDACKNGKCVAGGPKNCDDGNPCTDDTCEAGVCGSKFNTAPCSDNNACTIGDGCDGGACKPGLAKVCDDGNACTNDTCDPMSGTCSAAPSTAPCDDKNPCTQGDKCQGGGCAAGAPVNCDDGNACTNDSCDPKLGCVNANNSAPCSDGNACSQADTCAAGACVSGATKSCDDSNPCTNDSCDAASGTCVNLANAATCTDDNACTVGDACTAGLCKSGAAKVCADADTCTNDACDAASGNCVFKPITGCGGNCAGPADCKDGNPCTDDACASGKCAFPANALVCDDGNGCTTGDVCKGGACTSGAPKPCDDGKPCTTDACDAKTGACTNVANSLACDDGNPCTVGDLCAAGACAPGKATSCNDGNACTDDACDPKTGTCKSIDNAAACSDGSACTSNDTCAGGICKPGVAKVCDDGNPCTNDGCDGATGQCTKVNNAAPCSDNNGCTQGDVCAAGACKPGVLKSCDDGKVCTDDSCNATTGACVYAANTAACDDGQKCTSNDKCVSGSCTGAVAACNDNDACTNDSCDPATGACVYAPKVGCGGNCAVNGDCTDGNACTDDLCQAGKCAFPANTAACSDNNPCTTGDKCAMGGCVPGAPVPCDDKNPCTTDSCNQATGACAVVNNTAWCNDGNACTLSDACSGGSCKAGAAKVCNDNNPCTDDGCDTGTGSCTVAANTAACSDGNACTTADKCANNTCVGGAALPCDDGKPCTSDTCDPATGCKFTNITGACSDGNACTTGDACNGGACAGSGTLNCNDGNACTNDSCDASSGCKHVANTAACDDGNACTGSDMCNGGSCQPGLIKMCADLDSCTNDKCDPASGNCVFTPIVGCGGNCGTTADCNDSNPCTDDACTAGKCTFANNAVACDDKNKCTTSDVCSSGSCKGGPALNCDDLNPCTNDSCNASTGCQNVANTALCDDGNACTTGDICQQSVCKGGAAPNCDDGLPCTTDTCNSATGCVSAANTAACDDGDKCTTNDVCANSKCVAGPALVCNDNNPCTSDTCAASSGCQFPALPDGIACDDGSPCTMGDMCVNGSCSQGKAVWVDLFAGTVVNGASQAGFVDGAVGVGKFKSPAGLAFDRATGTLYVADSGSHAIRKVNAQGVVSTLAGTGVAGAEDNVGNKASFNEPRGVAVDSKGNVYVADRLNSRIRKIEPDGTVTTVSGGAGAGLVNGPIEKAKYMYPRGIAVASTGQLVVADTENHAIRVLDLAAGTVSTVAGSGSAGFQNGIGPSAMFNFPVALSLDEDNRAYVADQYNQRIRRVSPNGQVETIAGSGTAGFVDSTVDSTLGQFNMPQGIVFTLTASGPMGFIADTNNGRVRKMFPNNLVTLAGGGAGGLADGTGGSVSFNSPGGVAVDGSGFVYVSDTGKNVIRRIRDTAAPCSISGVCYVAGTLSSTTSCLACQPVNNKGDWSPVTGATTCSDGNPCTQNDACDNGKCTAGSSGPNCDDGNVCTNDACDAGSGKCVNTPGNNQAACSDTSPCTINEYCSNGTCVSGGAKCNDNNPCTTDFCNIIGNCVYTAVAYGTSCTPSSGNQTQGFCADTVCTGLEQSAAILQGTSTNSYRVTSVGRDQNNTLYATGFGKKADSNTNTTVFALQGDTPGVVPAAGVDMVTPGAGMEFWASAYRLITGGFNSFGNNDNSNIFAASYQSGWVYNAFTQPSSTNEYRIFRHAALLNFGGAEHYFYGGKPESGVTSTNLFHAQYNGSQWKTFGGTSGTWSGAASQVGRMNLFSSTDCLQGQMLKADIVGITAFTTSIGSGTQMFVAYNTASNGALPGVASSDYIGTSSCINLSPGGPVMLASATGTRGMFAPASTIQMTGVHGVSLSRVIAVGWDSAKSFPVVYSYTGSGGTWTVEAPSPPIPVGSPDATGNSVYSNFGVGPYRPTSVVLNGDDAWIAGRHASNTCSTMWVMHGRHDGNKWNWDKLLTSAATAKHCVSVTGGASNLLVSRVWYDTVKGNVFVSGAAGFDANGGAIIASGAASTQKGVVWRIQTK